MTAAHAALSSPSPHSAARIAAWSGALSLHLAALGLLLMPVMPPPMLPRVDEALEALWIEVLPPTPVAPLPPVPQPPVVPVRSRLAAVAPTSQPAPANPAPVVTAATAAAPIDVLPGSTPDASGVAGAGRDDGQLAYLVAPPPPYPRDALRKHQQGTVVLEVLVDALGHPRAATILRSSGHPGLDAAARRHVLRHWRFQPALRDGVAIPARGRVPVRYAIAAG